VTGIGAQVEQVSGVLTIVAPLTGSPAQKAGLKPGDQILSVNGESLDGLSYEDAVSKVRGPKGSTANLHIRRDGDDMNVTVVRDTVRVDDFTVTTTNNDVAVVALQQFGQLTDSEFRTKMAEVAKTSPRGIILDLRNNPGGLLDAAGVVTSAFLPVRSTYVQIISKSDTTEEYTLDEPVVPSSIPLIVLINKGSASAAEIVAGALQDSGRATLVGETTFGKGTVQQLLEFNDGSSLKMTIAEWRTPKGRKIDGVGVKPDLEVVNSETGDEQMDRALGLIH
jgi:carboxyl-terminal processing protease